MWTRPRTCSSARWLRRWPRRWPARARVAARRTAPARGEFAAGLAGLVAGAADLHAFGAQDTAVAAVCTLDRSLTRLARRSASGEGLGAGLIAAATGLTLWGVLLLG